MPRNRKHIHPGEVLRDDFLEPLGISTYRLAKEIGVSAQQLRRVVKGTRGVSGDLALRLGRFLGTSSNAWMNLQARYELDTAEDARGKEIRDRVKPFRAA